MATTKTVKRVYLLTKAGKRGLADYVRPEKKKDSGGEKKDA